MLTTKRKGGNFGNNWQCNE